MMIDGPSIAQACFEDTDLHCRPGGDVTLDTAEKTTDSIEA